ncbi:MAG: iron ABC transporter permease [Ignavibacteria bacterium]|nr:iron ABC transporter permease [Ignavibacteria bacterium]
MSVLTPRRTFFVLLGLSLALIGCVIVALSAGTTSIPVPSTLRVLTGRALAEDESARTIILSLRLPRILLALIVGGALSVAGATFQALLRNPLAEPYILGISSGGTLGAIIAITAGMSLPFVTTPLFAFVGAGLVMILVYALGHRRGFVDPTTLLLSGVMIGAFFNALILVLMSVAHQEIRTTFLWLLGNLSGASYGWVLVVGIPSLVAVLLLILQSRAFNVISQGDEDAMHMGIDVGSVRRRSYMLASLLTGLAVSVSGVIGFVGLVVPHICRLLFGPDHRLLMPASLLFGGAFLVLSDLLSRTILAPSEIPVGAITAAVGAPLFIYLLKRDVRF